jgi:hypothetical protein
MSVYGPPLANFLLPWYALSKDVNVPSGNRSFRLNALAATPGVSSDLLDISRILATCNFDRAAE